MPTELNEQHRAHLATFNISEHILEAAGVRSVTDFQARDEQGLHGKHAGEDCSGILFRHHCGGSRIRLDRPFVSDGRRYLNEQGDRHLFFAPGANFEDVTVPVVIVEAEKSALALAALAERNNLRMCIIALGGCWGFLRNCGNRLKPDGGTERVTGPSPDLDLVTWPQRRALIAYDSNVATNRDVSRAREVFRGLLASREAAVSFVTIPLEQGVNGPDDLIAKYKSDSVMLAALNAAQAALDWPEPQPLGDDLPSVPAFDLACLPASLRPLVADVAERMQVPLDLPAAAAVVALSGCVGRRARIFPKVEDTGWVVIPNLWGASIASPGFLKSPVMHAITTPLAHIEEMWREELVSQIADYELEKEKKELAHSAWRDLYKQALKKGKDAPVEPDTTLTLPVRRRLIVSDATPEKLQEILVDNPAGITVLRDELVGLVAEMEKEGRESQRAFFLQGWNGYGSFSVDRIGRGSIHIPHVCVSVFGNIQPARLRTYLDDALSGGASDDGFLQRFQIITWPDAPSKWELVDRAPDNTALARAEKIYSTLANLPTESVRLRFKNDAQTVFFDWWKQLEETVRHASGMHPALVAHLAKYRSLVPSLAGLFELADLVADNIALEEEHQIDRDHVTQAIAFAAYLEAHARRVYACITSPQSHAARQLASHITRGALPATFTRRDIVQHGWTSLDSIDRVEAALATLEDANWLRRSEKPTTPSGGRPTQIWSVNPKIPEEKR